MDPHLAKAFYGQIWLQCRFAQLAYDELGVALVDMAEQRATADYRVLADLPRDQLLARATELAMTPALRPWYSIQALLTAVANISKALWGQGGKREVERQPLRDALSVAPESPLRPTSMRNNFDHFDDRLDDWWELSATHNKIDLSFGDLASGVRGAEEIEMFRSFNPATGEVVFWGKAFSLPVIMNELERLRPLALHLSL